MRQTSLRTVSGLALLGAAIGWTLVGLFRSSMTAVPQLPWTVAGGLGLLMLALFLGAWYVYDRVHRKGYGVDALLAFRLLVLAKASALVGATIFGGYAGFGLRRMVSMGNALSNDQVIISFVSAGVSVLIVVGALLLERACKLPDDDEENRPGSANGMEPSR